MIILKTDVAVAPMVSLLVIQSADTASVITCNVERDNEGKPKHPSKTDDKGEWVEDIARVTQFVQWPGGSLEAACFEKDAVAIDGRVGRVVVEVEMGETVLPAFDKGRKSKTISTMRLRRVVELWATPEKALWKAKV